MKKLAAYVVFAFIAILAGCGGSGRHAFGKLAYVTGTVQVFAKAGGSWAPAENGATVCSGDSIRTAKNAEAVVTFGNNTIKLSENTCVTISDTLDGQNKRLIAVLNTGGEVLSDVKDIEKRGARYEVWTPTAVAHAEGTHFIVEFAPQPYVTNVHVLDGRVRVFNPFMPSAPQVYVAPGCFTRVGYNAAPVAAAPMSYGQFKKMQRVLGPRYYHDYEVRFKINPDEMVLDAPIVVVPVGVPMFLLPPPMPREPHGRLVMEAPFLLPPGPGMPLPRPLHVGMIAPVAPFPPGPGMPLPRAPHGGMVAPVAPFPPGPGMPLPRPSRGGMGGPVPPMPPGAPISPLPGPGRMVVPGPAGPIPVSHGEVFKAGRGKDFTERGEHLDKEDTKKRKDRRHKGD